MIFSRTETLPSWVEQFVAEWPDKNFSTPESRMSLAIALSQANIDYDTGGPTGAAIFRVIDGKHELYQVGVNRAVSNTDPTLHDPTAHAEMMAIRMATEQAGNHSLGLEGMPTAVLVTSAETCGMCMNAAHWGGISRLEIGARDEDMRELGYNEGIKAVNWREQMNGLGIEVQRDILRQEARAVLRDYKHRVELGIARLHVSRPDLPAYHAGMEGVEILPPDTVRPRVPVLAFSRTSLNGPLPAASGVLTQARVNGHPVETNAVVPSR
jgi:tRNA(Arg) A34 adenosine deaminase TadA